MKTNECTETFRVSLLVFAGNLFWITNGQHCINSIPEPRRTNSNAINSYFWIHLEEKDEVYCHGTLMLVAVVMQFFSFLLVMGPAFLSLVENGLIQRPIWLSTVTLVHASLGGVALATGIWIAASWHLQTSIENCIKRKAVMPYLFVIWILALILGITLYTLLYVFT